MTQKTYFPKGERVSAFPFRCGLVVFCEAGRCFCCRVEFNFLKTSISMVDCPRQRVTLTNTHFNPLLAYLRRRKWQPTPVLLPGESQGERSLAVCSPWGRKESDTTRRLNHHHQLTFLRCKAWLAKNVTFQAPLLLLSRHV